MSFPPTPAGRVDPKKRLRRSLDIAGPPSMPTELIAGPRLTGADQAENTGAAAEFGLTNRTTTTTSSSPAFTVAPMTEHITVSHLKGSHSPGRLITRLSNDYFKGGGVSFISDRRCRREGIAYGTPVEGRGPS